MGCGLGRAARYVATNHKNYVTGIDLTPEYIEIGKVLSSWLSLDNDVTLIQESALSMPFTDNIFDGDYMLHVGMNIEDKRSLFCEIYRVLKPGASFGIYDVMKENDTGLAYPVPWVTDSSTSKLSTPRQYKQALNDAGFELGEDNNRRDFTLEFFKQLKAKTEVNGGPSPLELLTLMQKTTTNKIKNMIDNIENSYIAPVEIIVHKC